MYARIEVAMRPEFSDPAASGLLRRVELAFPEIRRKIRWARLLDVYSLDIPALREDMIHAINEVFWDPVLQWLFTGNLIPKAAGKFGGLQDLMTAAPNRPGKFWALEKRFRPGVTDNVAKTTLEAFEIVLGMPLQGQKGDILGRVASGQLLLLEGPQLNEEFLSALARDVFCNELVESWTLFNEEEITHNDRFHQERIKGDIPRVHVGAAGMLARPGASKFETIRLDGLSDAELVSLSQKKLLALTLEEMSAIREHFASPAVRERRKALALPEDPTDVEIEVLAQTWSEHCKHKIFAADVSYEDRSERSPVRPEIPAQVKSLFKTTIAGATEKVKQPWLLSVFSDNAGIVAFDADDAFCIKVETHNSPSALDPYGGALTGIVGVNRDILGCGMGAKPVFNTDVFCVAPLDYAETLPDKILHPRRILDGIRRGVEHGGNKSGIPTVNGALVFDDRYLGKPLVYCGTGGFMPRQVAGVACETKEIRVGDRICMVGGRIGKDGIHGATFSSLAMDESSPASAVQLGDPITQKRAADFLLEARDQGLYRAITDNGAGGLSSSVGELAQLTGGAKLDVTQARTKYPGLKPYELVVSESQERMTVAVPGEKLAAFLALADKRGVEVSEVGEFNDSGRFDIVYQGEPVGSLDLEFLHEGTPRLQLQAVWTDPPALIEATSQTGAGAPDSDSPAASQARDLFATRGVEPLLRLLSRPNIASKEWMIRQYDHEVQGASVIKPLHTVGAGSPQQASGPNDGAVIKPKASSESGMAIGCGINPKVSDFDPYLMAQSAVDEAIRNLLSVGAEFGKSESVVALVDNFCWPDPVNGSNAAQKMAALVRACFGLHDAAVALGAPLVSGKDSMKNDYRGKRGGQPVEISVPPTLLMTAVGRVADIKHARTADFKRPGDQIYLLGPGKLGLMGSEFQALKTPGGPLRMGLPDWEVARKLYSWLGGAVGKEQHRMRSLHDISDGGLLVAIAEGLIARGLGAVIQVQSADPFERCFGEGFHSFVASVGEEDSTQVEAEWIANGVPFTKLGQVTTTDRLEVQWSHEARQARWSVATRELKVAWQKGGYWE